MKKSKQQRRRAKAFRDSPEEMERRIRANRNWADFGYRQLMNSVVASTDPQPEMIRKTPAKKSRPAQ